MSLTRSPTLAVAALRPTPFGTRLRRSLNPAAVVFAVAILVLLFLVIAPVARLLVSSFQSTDTRRLHAGELRHRLGPSRAIWSRVGNSLRYALEVTILSPVFAVPIAWGVSRTDMPAKGLVRALILGAFITPPYLGAIGWILLAGPNAGWLNRVWMALTGSSTGSTIYSFGGLVLVTALYSFPYIFIFTSAALDLVSSEMEDAANILGAGGCAPSSASPCRWCCRRSSAAPSSSSSTPSRCSARPQSSRSRPASTS